MAFAFDPAAPIRDEVRRLALAQIDAALKTIAAGGDRDEAVHSLRQRCKKLRGLLELIRPNFKPWQNENAAAREIAAILSDTRDSAVMVETLSGLVGDELHPVMVALRDHLGAAGARGDHAKALKTVRKGVKALRKRAPHWRLRARGFDALGDGFGDTYRRMRKTMHKAQLEPTDENFHAWRKEAKYHFYQLNLLQNTAPALIPATAQSAKRLADLLGQHHDLAVLTATLGKKAFRAIGETGAVIASADEKQAALETEAFAIGSTLCAEKPSAIVRRFAAYWHSHGG